jgi:3'-phosphoadenosine 5'-phosphosulfate sulfotransferase (PAPS reductase)/FAD synthetase
MDTDKLRELQSLDLEHKLILTKGRIQEWYEHWDGKVYVSFSGGKDSTVLLHIVRQLYPEAPAVFCDTGLEYPEIRQFVKSINGVVWLKPKATFMQVIDKYGYPIIRKEVAHAIESVRRNPYCKNSKKLLTGYMSDGKKTVFCIPETWKYLIGTPFKISEKCCYCMKKKPFMQYEKANKRAMMTGEMASDSMSRKTEYIANGCNAYNLKRPKSTPLGFWLESDIWEYIRTFNVPYSKIYDMGYDHTGCMFCCFGCHLEPEPNRFQRMQVTHPKQYDYCINGGQFVNGKWGPSKEGLGLGFVLDYIGVPYNDDRNLWPTKELLESR